MFRNQTTDIGKNYRIAVIGLSLLSAAALAITIWIMFDFVKEQSIVDDLMLQLPRDAKDSAEILAGELKWQFRLAILVVLNVVVTAIAVILLWRAYHASQTSLRDFKALAGDVISGMELGIITTDTDGNITSINRRGMELIEADASCVGKPMSDIQTVPLKQYRDDWMIERSTKMVRDFTLEHSGNPRKLRAFCQFLNDHEGKEVGHVLQLRDVTERVLIEERMRRMERYMGLGSLAGGLHHEIKNPLAALSLHVQLLEEQLELDDTSDENKQMLSVIRTEVTRIGGVLESFRDFASIDCLNTSEVDITAILRQQVELLRPQAHRQGVRIEFDANRPTTVVDGDQVRLEQVFLNLLINALEAMPAGGTLTMTSHREGNSVRIEVADTGCGVPESLRDKILDPYFTTKASGTGLGLALCDKIVRQHLGTLDFHTSPRGTTFEVSLPLATNTALTEADDTQHAFGANVATMYDH